MLTCQQLTEIITEYVEGRMSFWKRTQVWMHLGMCRHCRAYLRQMKTTARLLGQLPKETVQETMPADVKAELMKRFRAIKPSNTPTDTKDT